MKLVEAVAGLHAAAGQGQVYDTLRYTDVRSRHSDKLS